MATERPWWKAFQNNIANSDDDLPESDKVYKRSRLLGDMHFIEKTPVCLEVINPSDKEYVILCAGCSFTHCHKGHDEYPYASMLPGRSFNIGKRGIGICTKYFRIFFKKHPDVNLTHVVYQVPCPTRQPVDLNDYEENHFRSTLKRDDLKSVWMQISGCRLTKRQNTSLEAFDKIDQYYKKAMDQVDINVKLIRKKQPNVKIIFLRYEHTQRPLIYEFSKKFYKTALAEYCKKNNIKYIYEENFNTQWFKFNNYGALEITRKGEKPGVHPNRAGAKLIADKIKEYL